MFIQNIWSAFQLCKAIPRPKCILLVPNIHPVGTLLLQKTVAMISFDSCNLKCFIHYLVFTPEKQSSKSLLKPHLRDYSFPYHYAQYVPKRQICLNIAKCESCVTLLCSSYMRVTGSCMWIQIIVIIFLHNSGLLLLIYYIKVSGSQKRIQN